MTEKEMYEMVEIFNKIYDLFGLLSSEGKKSVLCMLIDDITINNRISTKELFETLLPVINTVNNEMGDFGISYAFRKEN